MLISGLTVEPRNLVCTKWFSDNTFFTTRLENWSRFFKSVLHPSYIQSFCYPHDRIHFLCDIYISALIFFFFYLSSSFFFVCYTLFSRFHIPFLLLSHTSLTHFPYHKSTSGKKKPTRGNTTPKRNMLLTNQILFALRLHFCWYLTFKTEGEQRFRCVSEWV